MALGGSLANYDINKLSDEMEKLGGGINIKSETNIAKFITERKKGKNKRSEQLDKLLRQKNIEINGDKLSFMYQALQKNDILSGLWAKGFNVNLVNFGEDNIIFGHDSSLPLSLVEDIIEIDDEYSIQISFFRISYDEESNQEFYLDLLTLDKAQPTVNTLKDLNMVKIMCKKDLERLLQIAYATDYGFKDERIFGTYVMNITLFEGQRYYSNMMLFDCNLSGECEIENIRNYTSRFAQDIKLLLKEASAIKLINIDTLNERIKKKSKLSQFFCSSVIKDSKTIATFSTDFETDDHLPIVELLSYFPTFETICYKSRNVSNTYLSTSTNILQFREFMKEHSRKEGNSGNTSISATPNSRSPIRSANRTIEHDKSTKRSRGQIVKQLNTNESRMDTSMSQEREKDQSFEDTVRPHIKKNIKKVTIRDNQQSSGIPNSSQTSFKVIEKNDSYQVESSNYPPRPSKYDLKMNYHLNTQQNQLEAQPTIEFKRGYVEYKRAHEENQTFRKELLKENERLENEIIELKANHEKEIESYRQNLIEINTKLHILLDREENDKFKCLIEDYEKDVLRLELQVKNLRDQMDFITNLNQQIADGELTNTEVGKLRDLLKIINGDLASKEDIISKYKHQERVRDANEVLTSQIQDEVRVLKERNKELYLDKQHLNSQVRELTEMCDQLKNENVTLYNEIQNQSMQVLNLNEQNSTLRDLIQAKKIELPENHIMAAKDSLISESTVNSAKSTAPVTSENRKHRAFFDITEELRTLIRKLMRGTLDNKVEFLIGKLEMVYGDVAGKHDGLGSKQKKYLDFINDLQVQMEGYLGKKDELVKSSNRQIRCFLKEVLA